ncbi:M13 family metallopeptidase [Flavobacterium sp.]|uniref:M13 family metallopeptidase n=1 Tax=Flavobacterium sp. TaxID=239 RepID=UPI0035B0C152
MKKILLSCFTISLLLSSCSQKEMASGISKKDMDTLINPGDDFDAYVNGNWNKTTKIPADKSSYGAFDMLLDKSEKDVKAIIEEAAKGNNAEGSDAQKIGDFFASYMDRKERDAIGLKPLQKEFAAVDAITDYNSLASYFGEANRKGYSIPFSFSVYNDFKDPNKYSLVTWQGGISLPDRDYYLSNDEAMLKIRTAYKTHLEKMLQLAGIEKPTENAAKVFALETEIAKIHQRKEDNRDMVKLYNPYKVEDFKTLMPQFNWNAMMEKAGVAKEKSAIIAQVDYLKNLDGLIQKTPIDTWKTFLKWGIINNSCTYLTTELDKQQFEFNGKILNGTEKQREDWKRAVATVSNGLGEMIGKLYVEKHFTPEAKERMTKMVKNLLKAYAESIKKLDWMSEATKKEALKKVDKFIVKIGYPDKWKDYSSVKINKKDLFGNVQRANEFEYNRNLAKLGKPVDKTEWGMTPQTVNAYYNPSVNEIVFPAAILQPPFFDLEADDAVNYGGIGAVIGHEIGHGFDDQGSTFDGDGVMKNWWTEKDMAAFKAKTAALVEQYNSFEALPGLHVNGAFTLGENIGDLGGLSIAVKAYKESLQGKEAPVLDGFTGMQRVFLGWGKVWKEKIREEALRNQILADPHSPAKFRANGTVRNIPEFYEAFNVKPNNKLYLAPDKRVKIW